jgi:hypothetical protein
MRYEEIANLKHETDNEVHNKVALALKVFARILKDSPKIQIAWARDTAMKFAKIDPQADRTAYDSFMSHALNYLVDNNLVNANENP